MKKFVLLSLLIAICSCSLTVGDFSEDRKRLHNMGHEDDYCEHHPDRCIQGIQW